MSESVEIIVVFSETLDNNHATWNSVFRLVKNSEVAELVIVDKSKSLGCTAYFSAAMENGLARLRIENRDITESLENTLLRIRLKRNQYIIQLHNDDKWEGAISKDVLSELSKIVYLGFGLIPSERRFRPNPSKDLNLPCRVYFSLIRFDVWNELIDYMNYLGNASSTFDHLISYYLQEFQAYKTKGSFTYYYNDSNWRNSHQARKKLVKLSFNEGWAFMSSPEVQMLGLSIDKLCLELRRLELLNLKSNVKQVKHDVRRLILKSPFIFVSGLRQFELTDGLPKAIYFYFKFLRFCLSILVRKNLLDWATSMLAISSIMSYPLGKRMTKWAEIICSSSTLRNSQSF